MNIYERCGRLTEALDKQTSDLAKTMKLLSAIKSGEIPIELVTVNKDGWEIADEPDGDEKVPAVAGKVGAGKAG